MGPQRAAVEFVAIRKVRPFELRQELQDAGAGDQRRTGLSHSVHAIASVLHGASEDERALEAAYLFRGGSLAELVRDGVVLHGSSGVVPQVSWRGWASVDDRAI